MYESLNWLVSDSGNGLHMFGIKPSPEAMMTYSQFSLSQQSPGKFESNMKLYFNRYAFQTVV